MLRSRRNELELPSLRDILPATRGVSIIHPFHKIVLFRLPAFAFTSGPGSEATFSYETDYRLLMDGCRVVTNGQGSDLHLVEKQDGSRVPSVTTALAPGEYYCHLDATSHEIPVDYEVVTEFAAWSFPHNNLPPHWNRPLSPERELQRQERFAHVRPSRMSVKVKNEDQHCIITKYSTSIQNAYIIPKDETDWFAAHHMEQYGLSEYDAAINDVANGMTLRADVRIPFDQHMFVICPTVGSDKSTERDKFEIHMVMRGASEYVELLHLRSVVIPDRISVEYLYARFAYTIISRIPKGSAREFKRVKVHDRIQAVRTARQVAAEESKNKKRKVDQISEPDNTEWDQPPGYYSTDMPLRCAQDPDACAEGDKLWRDQFLEMHPDLAEELSDPPETSTKWHTDTLRMLRLKSEYMRQNPQVWQTSMTPPRSVREDVEGHHADRLLSLTKHNRGA